MFTDFIFPRPHAEAVGLKKAELHNCKSLVVLAGPNGAGKSRYLKLVPELAEAAFQPPGAFQDLQAELESVDKARHAAQDVHLARAYEQRATALRDKLEILQTLSATTRWAGPLIQKVRTIALRYELAKTNFDGADSFARSDSNPYGVPPGAIEKQASAGTHEGFSGAAISVPAYFHEVARIFYDSEHPRQRESGFLAQHLKDAHAFNQVLEKFLGARIECGLDDRGRPLAFFRVPSP